MDEILPTHVAIVPDGNRRWAQMKGLSTLRGHQAGAERMHSVVEALIQRGIKYLTVWGFSTDNWKRTPQEIQDIFSLLQLWIEKETPWCVEQGVRLNHIGRIHELPSSLHDAITMAIDLTQRNQGMILNVAFNYSGRTEIVDAINQLLKECPRDIAIDEATVSNYLYTDGMPDVDLVIRTAEEFRISNFMLWQAAYAEYYFTPVFWPDFDILELDKALQAYSERKRRFGGDSEVKNVFPNR